MPIAAEYIWLDGGVPTPTLRSKTKIIPHPVQSIAELPEWNFDGSSTGQAVGHASDCALIPVRYIPDPLRGNNNILVLCEVMNADGSVHPSNTRARLRPIAEKTLAHDPWFGIEQEYTLFSGERPLGFPEHGFPRPQGPYYCAIGAENIFGRPLVEAHLEACLKAGLTIAGINAEVMPGQWEFQVGPLGALAVADELTFARYLLIRLGEDHCVRVSFSPKPVKGDWNGAGAHTNVSTKTMREDSGLRAIEDACHKLGLKRDEHIAVYGAENTDRLTGHHETCSIKDFRFGVSDRGASIRIPLGTARLGRGYFEDRRPAANMDPYLVTARILETICLA